MIELILNDRCTACGDCVAACPTRVFDMSAEGPVIARQADCQTCFLCELYCAQDALYVGPGHDPAGEIDAEAVRASGLLGQYRRDSGWGEWADDARHQDEHWRMGSIFARARTMTGTRGGQKP